MAEDNKISRIITRWEGLSGNKSKWHHHWDDLARVFLPRRLGFATTTIEGERRTEEIYDGTPMQAARGLANAVGGMVRPQGLPEVKIRAENDELNDQGEVQDWFGDTEERLRNAFDNPKAQFREASGEKDQDLIVFGTAVLFVGESLKRSNLLFQSVHLKDATVAFDEEGNPEMVFRRRMMPLRHLEARFGLEKMSTRSQDKIKNTPDDKVTVLHAVIPRKNGNSEALFARDLPIADMWIEIEAKHPLFEGGYHEFPYIVPRWDTSSGEDYGRSPGMIALPDADTLQAMGETILIAGQRAADPPLAVPNDGTFDAINTVPGGLAYYDVETAALLRGNPFFAMESGTNLPISRDMQLDTRQQVWQAFFRNIFNLPVGGPQMTAFEVAQRKEEFIREMGPIFGRLESSDTAPTVNRAFMVKLRSGGFLPIPGILSRQNVRFEYESPVKRIREQIEAANARLWAEEMLVLGQTQVALGLTPTAADLPDLDELGRFSAKALDIPRQIVKSVDRVAEVRAERAKQAEAQQAAAQSQEILAAMEQASNVAANFSKGAEAPQENEQGNGG